MNTTNVVNAYCLLLCTSIATQEVQKSIEKDVAISIDINDSNNGKAAFKDVDARASSLSSTSSSARLSSEFNTFVDAPAASNASIKVKSSQYENNQAMLSVLQSVASSASANKMLMPTSIGTNDDNGTVTSSQPRRTSLGSISNSNGALIRSNIVDNLSKLRRRSDQYDYSNNTNTNSNLLTSGLSTSTVNVDGDKENKKDNSTWLYL
jgi:hypothetical protein